jgi:hypothetical protein
MSEVLILIIRGENMKINDSSNTIILFLIPFIFFALLTTANAAKFYLCLDKNGNETVFSQPQDGMKCELKDTATEGLAEKEKLIAERIQKCSSCCADKVAPCLNYLPNGRGCGIEMQNCIANCNSKGNTPTEWGDCWSQSDK